MCFMQLSHIMKIYAHARTLFLAARPAKIPPHSTSTADKTQTEQCCSSVCECVAQIRWKCSSFPSPEAPPLCLRLYNAWGVIFQKGLQNLEIFLFSVKKDGQISINFTEISP